MDEDPLDTIKVAEKDPYALGTFGEGDSASSGYGFGDERRWGAMYRNERFQRIISWRHGGGNPKSSARWDETSNYIRWEDLPLDEDGEGKLLRIILLLYTRIGETLARGNMDDFRDARTSLGRINELWWPLARLKYEQPMTFLYSFNRSLSEDRFNLKDEPRARKEWSAILKDEREGQYCPRPDGLHKKQARLRRRQLGRLAAENMEFLRPNTLHVHFNREDSPPSLQTSPREVDPHVEYYEARPILTKEKSARKFIFMLGQERPRGDMVTVKDAATQTDRFPLVEEEAEGKLRELIQEILQCIDDAGCQTAWDQCELEALSPGWLLLADKMQRSMHDKLARIDSLKQALLSRLATRPGKERLSPLQRDDEVDGETNKRMEVQVEGEDVLGGEMHKDFGDIGQCSRSEGLQTLGATVEAWEDLSLWGDAIINEHAPGSSGKAATLAEAGHNSSSLDPSSPDEDETEADSSSEEWLPEEGTADHKNWSNLLMQPLKESSEPSARMVGSLRSRARQ
ncbi:hypothetical protein MLD38_031266 [Melastoma candidum]|uniref:Uncharacterized protein n=1 Tax=Melastoma candidum TaxID=119954 RepID=A0ACB9MNK7_9MYRT|nr:hypothetical protein MLD38_031266 [Melastoma candidum]